MYYFSSRCNNDLETSRISRVDDYVNQLNKRYEWQTPSYFDTYRSSSRINFEYSSFNKNNVYFYFVFFIEDIKILIQSKLKLNKFFRILQIIIQKIRRRFKSQ